MCNDCGIRVILCSHNGTAVERRTQAIIIDRYKDNTLLYSIKHPVQGQADIKVTIVIIMGQALVMVQDSKHALKTYWNNLSSGAQALTMGNFIVAFHYLLEMVK